MMTAHEITLEATGRQIRVCLHGTTLADSRDTIRLNEGRLPAVYYFPRADVAMESLRRSEHRSHCPFKGDAVYWDIQVGDEIVPNGVWSYEQPLDEVAAIAQHLAFYPQHVELIEVAA